MLKSRVNWKGLDRKYFVSSDPYKNIYIVFMTYKPGCYMVIYSHIQLLYRWVPLQVAGYPN